jgi:hypothetical protein
MSGISPAEYARRLKTLTLPVIREKMYVEMKQDEPELRELKIDELKHGERPDGSQIGTYKNAAYQKFKQQKNPTAKGKVDLVLSGKFSQSVFLPKGRSGKYLFGARDRKKPILTDRYGGDIMGLNQKTFNEYQIKQIPEVLKKLKQYAKIR